MISDFLISAWFMSLLLGRYDAAVELPAAEQHLAAYFAEAHWGPLEPLDAIDWFRNKLPANKEIRAIIEKFLAAEGKSLDDYRANLFTLSGVEKIRLLQVIRDSILKALKDGTTFADWKKDVDSYFVTAGYEKQDPWHLETIFRTNLFSAYNAGRYRQGMATSDLLPYWQYKAVLDSRTRASHARMNNFIARKDDPVWDLWFPPNGFNCRCTVISLTEERAAREDRGMPPVGIPDEGFDRNPGKQDPDGRQALEDMLHKAEQQYDKGWKDV